MTEIIKTKCPVCGQINEEISQLDLDRYPKNEKGEILAIHGKCLHIHHVKKKRKCKLHHKCRRCSEETQRLATRVDSETGTERNEACRDSRRISREEG